MDDIDLVESVFVQRQFQCILDVRRGHAVAELPRDDVSREVIQDGREVEPSPAGINFQVGEVCLARAGSGSRFLSLTHGAFITMKAGW